MTFSVRDHSGDQEVATFLGPTQKVEVTDWNRSKAPGAKPMRIMGVVS